MAYHTFVPRTNGSTVVSIVVDTEREAMAVVRTDSAIVEEIPLEMSARDKVEQMRASPLWKEI